MMMQKVAFSSRIGDRWTFAIEFEGIGDPPKAWNEWWGSLWLWVDGHVVGRSSEIEMVMTGFDSLVESAQQTRTGLSSPLQPSVPAGEALDLVMWARYGSDDRAPGRIVGDPSALTRYEVLPRLTGPFFDGWEAVLLTQGEWCQEPFQGEEMGGKGVRNLFRKTAGQKRGEKRVATTRAVCRGLLGSG